MNKREHRRAEFIREVALDSVNGKTENIEAHDISTTGMGLTGPVSLRAGELLNLKFKLRMNGHEREIKMAGEIKYVKALDDGYFYGVRFL